MDVYTTYTLFFAVIITACVLVSALFNAYIIIKVRKTLLFWGYILVQIMLLIWIAGKLLELSSPTLEIMSLHITIQKIGCLILVTVLLIFLFGMWKYGMGNNQIFCFCGILFVILTCILYALFIQSGFFSDFVPILSFIAFNAYTFYFRRSVFVELSEVSIEMFMERLDDAVVIFDRSGKLLDFNQNAKIIFHNIAQFETMEDFFDKLKSKIVSGNMSAVSISGLQEPVEISVKEDSGIRHYLYSMTISRNKKDMPIATVLIFHDVTENSMLLNELENKNLELDSLNNQLKSYITVANRLEEEREKYRAVLEIQETIGQSIMELLVGLEVLKTTGTEHESEVKEKLSEIIYKCRKIMAEIRVSVEKLTPQYEERN